ncbi:hypothetical protein SJ05684_c25090 [Sinorhizobium sojae CCBAU 05684]|uniref:Uncharacterized protein n=1 Tax=Sinorhizobium sojae CCBAU 05684 TaxID=716928 RepID=A0A249PDF7_9HYPH|nr:hypothetical protein SJ05684_c25090 [Sinorhizobium sojae CCBAU 05684]
MADDALFQSGMGSVDAPRTEERFLTRAHAARPGKSCRTLPSRRAAATIPT